MKKSYNPLKMWGSWVGAVVPYSLGIIYDTFTKNIPCTVGTECSDVGLLGHFIYAIEQSFSGGGGGLIVGTPSPLLIIPIGFLLGWGIHSLIRAIRR